MRHTKIALCAAAFLGYGLLASVPAQALCGYCAPPYLPNGFGGCIKPTDDPTVTPDWAPVSYSTDSGSTTPGFAGVSGGIMSNGGAAGGARIASKGLAGVSPNQWCKREGRTQSTVDACLKAAGN